jgi:hypothetical protein
MGLAREKAIAGMKAMCRNAEFSLSVLVRAF